MRAPVAEKATSRTSSSAPVLFFGWQWQGGSVAVAVAGWQCGSGSDRVAVVGW
jgi:hypothetical protein